MRYVLFATAGHVDHGKTTLINRLTGIDTDRLPEEKKRGLSIDIGFAYLDFPDMDARLELIDIPGHERFVKNAIAGLSSVSGLILVVDAGEGVMPQTREHLSVAKALEIRQGVAVLTKIDKVNEELIVLAKEELESFLREEGFKMPVLGVSAKTGEGLKELRGVLKDLLAQVVENRENKPLRVFVDSAFVVKGYGTVLRGSCVEGKVMEGDRVVVEPLGESSRVRKLQNHGRFVKEAVAGERIAMNIPDVSAQQIERGFWVLKPDTYTKSDFLLISADKELKPGKLYTVFVGMRELRGRLRSVSEEIYLLKLEEEVVAKRGDRILILDARGRFLCGGEVLHPAVRVLKKGFIRENIELLRNNFELYLLKENGLRGLTVKYVERLTAKKPNLETLNGEGVLVGSRFYPKESLQRLKKRLREFLEECLKDAFGVEKSLLCEKFRLSAELLDALLSDLKEFKQLQEYVVSYKGENLESLPQVKKLLELLKDGFKEEKELASAGITKDILSIAVKRRLVHRLGEFLFISEAILNEYIGKLMELGETFSVQDAKTKLSLSRKHIIPLLEYLDYMGLTRREGDLRRWLHIQRHRP